MFKRDGSFFFCKPLYRLPSNSNRSNQGIKRKIHPRHVRSPTRQSASFHFEYVKVRAFRRTPVEDTARVSIKEKSNNKHSKRGRALFRIFSSLLSCTPTTSRSSAIERLFIKIKCSSTRISKPFLNQYQITMPICTSIIFR